MQNSPYTLTELIQNDSFIAWVLHPDELSDRKWQNYLAQFPHKKQVVEDARGYVILLAEDTGRQVPKPEQSARMWKNVAAGIQEPKEEEMIQPLFVPLWRRWYMAASVVVLIGAGLVAYPYLKGDEKLGSAAVTSDSDYATVTKSIQDRNNTKKPKTILLADGSSVVLYPGAQLTYSSVANGSKREVSLVGTAFFEVVKDTEKPFFVYTNGLTTKVLGTSFLIDAREDLEEINVEVRTGRVSVFPGQTIPESSTKVGQEKDREGEGIILTKDQRIVISRLSGKPVRPLVTSPTLPDGKDIARQEFVFDETPVSEVFEALEVAYNINILYDESSLSDCPLNATLIGQSFNNKLAVICSALGATYEIKGNEVVITGNGCK